MKDYKENLVSEAIERYGIKKWTAAQREGLVEQLIDWYGRTDEFNAKEMLDVYIQAFMEDHGIKLQTA